MPLPHRQTMHQKASTQKYFQGVVDCTASPLVRPLPLQLQLHSQLRPRLGVAARETGQSERAIGDTHRLIRVRSDRLAFQIAHRVRAQGRQTGQPIEGQISGLMSATLRTIPSRQPNQRQTLQTPNTPKRWCTRDTPSLPRLRPRCDAFCGHFASRPSPLNSFSDLPNQARRQPEQHLQLRSSHRSVTSRCREDLNPRCQGVWDPASL